VSIIKRLPPLAFSAILACLTALAAGPEQWSRAALEGLFPRPPAGWTLSEMKVEEMKTFAQLSGLEDMADLIATAKYNSPIQPGVRYRLTREYRSGARTIVVTVDSEDIATANSLFVLNGYSGYKDGRLVSLPEDKKVPPEKLAAGGFTPVLPSDHLGILSVEGAEVDLGILLGENGVLSLHCASRSGLKDMETLMAAVDFPRLDEFARFDHRKPLPAVKK
jgi:hypothetical protein